MFYGTFALILQTVAGFFTALLLVRTVMRFQRISFVSQLGQFVLATTNWAVLPFQKWVPSVGKLDLCSLLPAWLIQVAVVLILGLMAGKVEPVSLLLSALVFGFLGLIKAALQMLFWVVILSAVLSWVNPHSPLAGPLHMFTRPFLAPFRRVIPPIANVDLSPLVLLLVLQILMFWLP
ncbi:YggT family protein [Uliginosibacterium sp. IMCC34675]|uniref:YggT family protein n=1 Tax=Uliginosibacterium aquaticum TaxID=2731212 RepID=A0ABX2ICE6_9RHOO|nr:YggT family protein [Uliginosibacterium aquaticum]